MALIRWEPRRWEPSRELDYFHRDVQRVLGSLFDSQTASGGLKRWSPAIDVAEEGDKLVLRADLPGVGEDDVKVELNERTLTISGERKSSHEDRKDGYYRLERAYGSFSRSLRLPEGVDAESIHAEFNNGVLEVTVPKPAARQPKRVAINASAPAGEPVKGESEGGEQEVASAA
jgi:HSP20 family protein